MGLSWLGRLIWPGACAACGGACDERGLCGACALAIDTAAGGAHCQRCGATLGPFSPPLPACGACRGRRFTLARVVAIGPHDGALRLAVRRLKFYGHEAAARPLGRLLAERVRAEQVRADVVVAVPLDPSRERRRGFNQAAAVAEVLAGRLGLPFARDALRRVRPHDRSQTELGLLDRAAAVAGAFAAAPGARAALGGRRVLLVDDVLTTGATISACADACRSAGARTVTGACVARRHGPMPVTAGRG